MDEIKENSMTYLAIIPEMHFEDCVKIRNNTWIRVCNGKGIILRLTKASLLEALKVEGYCMN